jgi:hypothetical protein
MSTRSDRNAPSAPRADVRLHFARPGTCAGGRRPVDAGSNRRGTRCRSMILNTRNEYRKGRRQPPEQRKAEAQRRPSPSKEVLGAQYAGQVAPPSSTALLEWRARTPHGSKASRLREAPVRASRRRPRNGKCAAQAPRAGFQFSDQFHQANGFGLRLLIFKIHR